MVKVFRRMDVTNHATLPAFTSNQKVWSNVLIKNSVLTRQEYASFNFFLRKTTEKLLRSFYKK